MFRKFEVNFYLFILALCSIPWLGLSDFSTRGEPREALVVQDILRGNWILPHGYSNAIASKPPLMHWAAAIFSRLFGGASEFTIRLPSAIFCAFGILAFLFFCREALNRDGRLFFAITLSLSFEWLRAGLSARVDMAHASSLAVGLLVSFLAVRDRSTPGIFISGALFGISTLAKGPVGLVLPGLVWCSWLALHRMKNTYETVRILIPTFLLAVVIGSSWYYAAFVVSNGEFWKTFWYENGARFTSSMADAPHDHSVFYLAGVTLLGCLPWTPLALWLLYVSRPRSRSELRSRIIGLSELQRFALTSVVVISLFYCIPSSKRSVYLLAAYPFAALLLASAIQARAQDNPAWTDWMRRIGLAGCLVVLLVQSLVMPLMIAPGTSERTLSQIVSARLPVKARIYSFGFEFYGASFYSELPFQRIEDTGTDLLRIEDLLVYYEGDLAELLDKLKGTGLKPLRVSRTTIGKSAVEVAILTPDTAGSS
jgi:4-amino-4-deoxy-L-arabinose transferase-like glycosyltransferase